MKLTDIMFNLEYIAANTGAQVERGVGEIFQRESLIANNAGTITLSAAPIGLGDANQNAYVWYRAADSSKDMVRIEAPEDGGLDLALGAEFADKEICVMYRKSAEGKKITISSQFIPDTLHAVLTIALFAGDACDVQAATKAGEVTIDIPRLQLTGAMDISMSASGAAQTPLEGNALASGCTGCDGKAIYATITQVIDGKSWIDEAQSIAVAGGSELEFKVGVATKIETYAIFASGSPVLIPASQLKYTSNNPNAGSINDAGQYTASTAEETVKLTIAYPAVGDAQFSTILSFVTVE